MSDIAFPSPALSEAIARQSLALEEGRIVLGPLARTDGVLDQVREERSRQVARYGDNADLEGGTGSHAHWLSPFTRMGARYVERVFRGDYEKYEALAGKPTWMHLIREEVAEAFLEEFGSDRQREELIQVAALCVSMVEKIDAKKEAAL